MDKSISPHGATQPGPDGQNEGTQMAMTKKDFIALADTIRNANRFAENAGQPPAFTQAAILELTHFCRAENPNFNRERWLDYIAGKCGPNGGSR